MIKLNKVCFSYDGEHPVLVDFCMEIPDGGAIAVMGASGSGKTTLLRILLGLEKPNSGEILGLNNKRFAVVFQEDRLLQHRTARQNVEIPLIGRTQIEKTNVHKIAGTALRDVELNGFENFSVRELSGGMCRRVALARAIAFARSGLGRDAAILDEPLKGLDNAMKKRIVPRFIDAFATRVIITHDENEAELFECGTIIRLNRI
jgi:NitT/TauT family transport system ATP-binding protein